MIDFTKLATYSKSGPRYTSYPTAVEFASFTPEQYEHAIDESNAKGAGLSLYVHLPFCKEACYFCACSTVYTTSEDKKSRYLKYLLKELKLLASKLDKTRKLEQLHFGGGTPTYYSPKQLDELIGAIFSYFTPSKNAEISCEIDPRYFTQEHMEVLKKGGFNRVSFGVQDFNLDVQKAVNRIQSFELCNQSMQIARDAGIKSVNIDLIYGLPYQTQQTFALTRKKALELNPDRLAIFNYAHVPWVKSIMNKIDETKMPSTAEKLTILRDTIDFYISKNYRMIGMDHFAKPDDELFKALDKKELHRNFQGYTTKGDLDLFGMGITAIGNGSDWYGANVKDIKTYETMLDDGKLPINRGLKLNEDDIIKKAVIMDLMANFHLDIEKIEKNHNISFGDYFKSELTALEPFIKDELLTITPANISISETGKFLIRNIASSFDAYRKEGETVFSKTI